MHYSSSQRGFSLIEVLVAVVIVAIGLVGVAGMQFVGLKGNQQAFSKNQAAHHVQALLERMRSNPNGVSAGNYVVDSSTLNCSLAPAANCGLSTATCSSEDMANYDLFSAYCGKTGNAFAGMKGGLSNASLNITCAAGCDDGLTFSLAWDEQKLGEENSGSVTVPRELVINTVIK
ncbi:type IV pilus modification protein PilV [Leucothrix arctica]|uniref:Type IV pilus modification protein PilV n=1 Tax=Leucothrix arctica TaxID=1481894 RepID=A0A317CN84_9GAMM|nr:type IV pilus modification protein PilV [Leucothrix arctica]PWQ98933.1 type IV pilus modification protein PilV [Leucothrix arctica]